MAPFARLAVPDRHALGVDVHRLNPFAGRGSDGEQHVRRYLFLVRLPNQRGVGAEP
ncbi:hypothetical protein PSMK_p00110 (plasmid) [Phycisphaera mikurensis NBRC 102666]|uniref:Uncharacterized protein n=1 Tax=Phycisphaera mikurensis (strain NBRC 102666 / KCTC 22515 / FYK2301M01) TaxID=1142394 RepID=I0IJD5_PHYMF|nr:hypothetical protein PSMK_p00110 [Phycisphaera mikurensis NBRC 102666]